MPPVVTNEQYRSAYTKNNFMAGDTAGLVAGVFSKVGQYQVVSGEAVSLGYGANESMEGSPGRIYMSLKDSANAALSGIVRFSIWSPQNRPIRTLWEAHTSQLATDAVDRTKQIPFPASPFPFVTEDKKIIIEFCPDAGGAGSGTLSKANSTVTMDVTLAVAI